MTSINLISPIDKADDFSVRFRDPITIAKNSKIYLNYAHLSRINEVRFKTDQTITLSDLNFIPRVQPHDGLTPISLTTDTITIPAVNPLSGRNGYKIKELEKQIFNGLTSLIGANPELNIYSAVFDENTSVNKDNNQFQSGLFLAGNTAKSPHTEFSIDGTHSRDAGIATSTGEEVVYCKTSATAALPHYDSYALSPIHFNHFSIPCKEDNLSSSYIKVKTNVNMSAQQGNIAFGLYCKEFTDHPTQFTGWVNKTRGANATIPNSIMRNPAIFRVANAQLGTPEGQVDTGEANANNLRRGILGSFLSIEITGINDAANRNRSQLKISMPRFNATRGNIPKVWTSIDQNFVMMETIDRISLRNIFGHGDTDLDRPFECFVLFYMPTDNQDFLSETDRKIYFKIYKEANQSTNLSEIAPIYDSRNFNIFYPQSFFTGLGNLNVGNAGQKKAKVESAIPFNLIAAAQTLDEGFTELSYSGFLKNANGATAQKPNTILTTYKMNFSDHLGEIVGGLTSEVLFPSVCEMNPRFHYFEDVISKWKSDSFDIYLNGLPIKNFKNTEDSNDGGFSKPLLCSVPVPFLFGNSSEGMGASHSILTGLYQPSIKNVLKLKNQEKIINSLSVQIKDTNSEEPASELRQAHISFTITDEEEE